MTQIIIRSLDASGWAAAGAAHRESCAKTRLTRVATDGIEEAAVGGPRPQLSPLPPSPLPPPSPLSSMTPLTLSHLPSIDLDRVGLNRAPGPIMSRAKPKIRIVSRPRKPKPAVVVDPGSGARTARKRRRPPTTGDLSLTPIRRDVWGRFPSPLGRQRPVPEALAAFLVTGHRWFKPELVHQTLYNLEGQFETALQYMYHTWLNGAGMRRLYADIHDYIVDVSDDVFAIDPDRYVKIRPDQVIQLENPSGSPVFIHQRPATVPSPDPAATISVYSDTSVRPSELKLVMNDAALQFWGYTRDEWEAHKVHDVEDPSVADKIMPFFFALFADSAAYAIVSLNLAIFYLRCKFASFRCHVMRRDGRIVPVLARFTTYLHGKHVHVSQFAFTDLSVADPGPCSPPLAADAIVDAHLPILDLPVLHGPLP